MNRKIVDKIVKSDGRRTGAPCKFAVSLSQCLQTAETEVETLTKIYGQIISTLSGFKTLTSNTAVISLFRKKLFLYSVL